MSRSVPPGSYLAPSFERAHVGDAMRPCLIGCPAETPMRVVAQMMAQQHIHSVVITDMPAGAFAPHAWAIVSDIDVLRAAEAGALEGTAADIAATEFLTVGPQERLADAARLMATHEVTHLVVCDENSGRPIGVLSSLDVAGVIAWGEA